MSFSNAWETKALNLFFANLAATGIGDVGGLLPSVAAGNLYIALHSADPGEAGNQSTSELSYTGYARVAVVRSAGGWTIASDTVSNAAQIQFGQCTAGSGTAAYFSVGLDSSGAGVILMSGALSSSLAISNGITPLFAIGALQATLD